MQSLGSGLLSILPPGRRTGEAFNDGREDIRRCGLPLTWGFVGVGVCRLGGASASGRLGEAIGRHFVAGDDEELRAMEQHVAAGQRA